MRQTPASAFHKGAEAWSQGVRQKRIGTLSPGWFLVSTGEEIWLGGSSRRDGEGARSPGARPLASAAEWPSWSHATKLVFRSIFFFLTGKFFKNPEKQKKLIQWASHNKLYQHFLLTLRHFYFFFHFRVIFFYFHLCIYPVFHFTEILS